MSNTEFCEVMHEDHDQPPRTIVLCFDGTNAQYGANNTNVVKFFGLLRKDCAEQQVTYYQAGIGTYFAPGVVSPLFAWVASILDGAFAWYLDEHVMGGYQFLMDNYRFGDKICLFGFSRGAYTARALAGMLTKVGLLPKDNLEQVKFAYKTYKRADDEGIQLAARFKQIFSRDVKVEFVGVWDTVESTGALVRRELPFTDTNTAIRVFRHALSLDERRSRYQPNLYHLSVQKKEPNEVMGSKRTPVQCFRAARSAFLQLLKKKDPGDKYRAFFSYDAQRDPHGDGASPGATQTNADLIAEGSFPCTDVLEVWFSGCHSDVGGGSVRDDVKVSLGRITLRWMAEQVMLSESGILFNEEELAHIGFKFPPLRPPGASSQKMPDPHINDPATGGAVDVGTPTSHQVLDKGNPPALNPETIEYSDATAPIFDQLELKKWWWLLEIVPMSYAQQDSAGEWHRKWRINLGRGRSIPNFGRPKFHHTVKERMDCLPLKYKPRAIWDNHEIYV